MEIRPSYEWAEDTKGTGASHRELEVPALPAKGSDNHETAEVLGIQYQSVKNHMYNLTKKLRAGNSTQALPIAVARNHMRVEDTWPAKPEECGNTVKFLRMLDKAFAGEDSELTKKTRKWLIRHGIGVDIW